MSSAIPTTEVQGIVSAEIFTHLPIASAPGQSRLAMLAPTTIAPGAPGTSCAFIARPFRMCVPSVEKYSGVTAFRLNWPSVLTESIPSTYKLSLQLLQNGTLVALDA